MKKGNVMNSTSDGITSQNIPFDNWITCKESFVSMYNQIIAITDTSGIEARTAPKNVLRFETSEIKAIRMADISIFIIFFCWYYFWYRSWTNFGNGSCNLEF